MKSKQFDRALVVRKPHVGRILSGVKIWEMRTRKPPKKLIGKRIGLIEKGSGLIVGSVILSGCGQPLNEFTAIYTAQYHMVADLDLLVKWRFPWILKDVTPFKHPIPYHHPQGAVIWVKV